VPFQGGPPAVTSTIAGHTQILHLSLPIIAPLIRDGKLRILAVADNKRSSEFPDTPTLEEEGISGREVGFWDGIVLPKGAPDEVVERIHRQVSQVIASPEVQERLKALGYTPINASREKFAALIQSELLKWRAVVRENNIGVQ
jgi:tripartite-type tricarboxylate transporter receptor subunit TctC